MTDGAANKTPKLYLAILVAVSIILGVWHLRSLWDVPQLRSPVIDELSYDTKARGILDGSWPGKSVFYQDPLYPYFLSAIYKIGNPRGVLAAKFANVLMGAFNVLLIFALSRRAFGRRTALVAAAISALYKPLFFFEGILSKEILSLTLATAGLWLLLVASERGTKKLWAAAGFALGLVCLTRANFLLLLPPFALFAIYVKPASNEVDRAFNIEAPPPRSVELVRSLKGRLIAAAIFTAGALVAIMPATIHNIRSGDFVLLTSQGGQNFYIGNHPGNDTGSYVAPDFLRAHPLFEEKDFRAETKRRMNMEMKPSEISRFWYGVTMDYANAWPRDFWLNMWLKFKLYFNDYEIADNVNYYFYRERFSRVLRLPLFGFGIVSALSIFGWIALLLKKADGGGTLKRGGAPLLVFLPVYAGSTIAYYIFDRYRVPGLAAMIPLAAFGVTTLSQLVGDRKWKTLAVAGAMLFVLFRFAYLPLKTPHFDVAHFQLGNGYAAQKRYAEAEREYRRAVVEAPDMVPYRINLGHVLEAQGKNNEAAEQFAFAVTLDPKSANAIESLANIYAKLGRTEDAIVYYEAAINAGGAAARLFYNAGLAYKTLGMKDSARTYFMMALEKDPTYQPAIDELQ